MAVLKGKSPELMKKLLALGIPPDEIIRDKKLIKAYHKCIAEHKENERRRDREKNQKWPCCT